jgi:hypothetical protein
LWTLRDSANDRWDEIAEALYPIARAGIANGVSASEAGIKRETLRATNFAQEMLKRGASGFAEHLTNPARPWFELGPTLRLQDSVDHGVKVGLEELSKGMREVFEASGVYNQVNKLYEHLVAFGTGCMLVFGSTKGGYHLVDATTLRFGTYALGIDADGSVNRVVRKFEFTINQLVEAFGLNAISEDLKNAYERGNGAAVRVTVVNLIEPNPVGNVFDTVSKLCEMAVDKDAFKYRSIYWTEAYGSSAASMKQTVAGHGITPLLAVRGIRHNPIIAPRLEREAGDVWGRGRGIDALATARMLAQVYEDSCSICGNTASPALAVSETFQGRELSLGRGGINFGNTDQGTPSVPMIPMPASTNGIETFKAALEKELSDTFFVSRFSIIDSLKNAIGEKKTATEINQLVRENMGMLGPVVTSLDSELLDPLVRTIMYYTIDKAMEMNIDIQPLAPVLDGDIKVRYVGEIHQAMKSSNLSAIERAVQFVGGVAQMKQDPAPFDVIQGDTIIRDYCDALGVDPSNMTSPDKVDEMREARAQQQQQMMQMQALTEGAKAAKDGASAASTLKQSGILNELQP